AAVMTCRYAGMLLALFLAVGACSTTPTLPVPTTVEGNKKALEDRLGPIWYRLVKANEDQVAVGTVKAYFEVPPKGGANRPLRIIPTTGNLMTEAVALNAIEKLRAPPIPLGLLKPTEDHINFEEEFTIFANRSSN